LFKGSYVWSTLFSAAYTQHPYTVHFLFGLSQRLCIKSTKWDLNPNRLTLNPEPLNG